MDIHFQHMHEGVRTVLKDKIGRKVTRLSRYLGYGAATAQAYIEISRATNAHQSGKVWQTILNLDVEGRRYRAAGAGEAPDTAAYQAVRELESELKRTHAKNRKEMKREGGFWKSMTRSFGV